MNFTKALSSDSSRKMIETIATAIGKNKDSFEEVLHIAYTAKGMPSSRAARVIDLFIENNPNWGELYANNIAENIIRLNDSRTQRSLCRILTRHLPQDSDILGYLIDFGFNSIHSKLTPIALKIYAIKMLFNITMKIPEISNELILCIETELYENSSAFKAVGRNTLRILKKN